MADENYRPLFFHRILITIDEDDRPSTARAFRFALTMARDYGAELGITSVLENNDISIYESLMPAKLNQKRTELQNIVKEYADKAKEFGVENVRAIVSEGGDVDDVILQQIVPDFQPDLIVCGADVDFASHGKPGAIGLRLARKSDVSVIVIR
ncbi:universal stress protein [Levilactobacillus namurensis]|uniref:Universal stress protein n=1 Tax=Levilactobacillus namurensis TaxID=380393 RepID=A0AAW8W2S0_9LACO|nr:universal stress protein [Levilactobacillus namurensis]PTM24093.1 universal stress protein [Lactobacillus sp. PFC-70]MCW3778299.1 universal stress protein [Levilactobacillus namurensis]MDT7013802.1 universal stress protein [Levilactobacillus namurensis]MDT7019267.1 universal stress protein [Levilactobacillus namurensis]WNN66131.1 universal stress protein [Levilactobacillus namurensis]